MRLCGLVAKKKLTGFALIIAILPAFRWRKLLSSHAAPLMPVDVATLAATVVADLSHILIYRDVLVMGTSITEKNYTSMKNRPDLEVGCL